MHYLYILHSKKLDRYYVGQTADVEFRINLHLNKVFSKSFTSKSNDWEIVFEYEAQTKEEFLFLERFIKRMKSRKFIEKVIMYPNILGDILTENK